MLNRVAAKGHQSQTTPVEGLVACRFHQLIDLPLDTAEEAIIRVKALLHEATATECSHQSLAATASSRWGPLLVGVNHLWWRLDRSLAGTIKPRWGPLGIPSPLRVHALRWIALLRIPSIRLRRVSRHLDCAWMVWLQVGNSWRSYS